MLIISEFLPTVLVTFYILFLPAFYLETQKRAAAEMQRSMLTMELEHHPSMENPVKGAAGDGPPGNVLIDGKPTKACVPNGQAGGKDRPYGGGALRLGEAGIYLRLWQGGRGAVRLLHPGHGHLRQGSAGRESRATREEAAFAIRNNICRCTGYVKIIDGILLAAEIFRAGQAAPIRR